MGAYNVYTSPFVELNFPFTTWEAVKTVLLLPLIPVKLVIVFTSLTIVAVMNTVALIGWKHTEPLPVWRRRIVAASRYPAKMIMVGWGFKVKVTGWENVQKAYELRAIGVFNHVSYFDALVLFSILAPTGVARESTEHIPLVGRCIKPLQMVYVPEHRRQKLLNGAGSNDHTNGNGVANGGANGNVAPATNGAAAATAAAAPKETTITDLITQRLKDPRYCRPGGFPLLVIAPEGTVTNGRQLLPYKSGGFVAGSPVLPIVLDYRSNKCHNPAWYETKIPYHMLRLLCQFVNHLEVRFLEPHVPSEEEKSNPVLYAENMRKLVAKEMDVPLCDDSFINMKKLQKLEIETAWHGRYILDPHGYIKDGMVDLDAPPPAPAAGGGKKKTQ